MTVGKLIKKLAQYDFEQTVFLVNLSDDSGESDKILRETDIDEKDGYVLICHTPMEEDNGSKTKTMNSMEWISVKDRLPELEQEVLLLDHWTTSDGETKDIRVGYLNEYSTRKTSEGISHHCGWGGTEFSFNITHWMPLPDPPPEENPSPVIGAGIF